MKQVVFVLALLLSLAVIAFAKNDRPEIVTPPIGDGVDNYCRVPTDSFDSQPSAQDSYIPLRAESKMSISDRIGLATFFATFLGVIVAGLYANYTLKMLKIMRTQYLDASKPKIHVKIERSTDPQMFYLVIKNIGNGIASDVTMTIDKDFYMNSSKSETRNIKNYPAFSNKIAYVPPGEEYVFYLDQPRNVIPSQRNEANGKQNINPSIFKISISYSYDTGFYEESYSIDLGNYLYTTNAPSPLLHEIRKLNQNIQSLLERKAS